LQKFEANSFELDLPPLYVRGFVRAYARHLDLDAARFLSEYDTLMAGEGRAPRRETRENFGRVEFGGEGEAVETPTRATAGLDPVLLKYGMLGGGALVLIVIILLIVNLFSGNSESRTTAPKQTGAEQTAQPASSVASAANTVQMLTLTALDQTRVKIVQDSDKAVIYEGALARGESRNFRKAGKLLITVEKGSNIRMEVNGRGYPVPLEGYGRFALD
jgi:cytoskeleton protein RodZ